MINTTNYNLIKQSEDEKYDINIINQNMDIIDTNLKSLPDEIDTIKSDIPSVDNLVSNSELSVTLSSYAKKTDLPEEYDDTELITRVTNVEDVLDTKAEISDIPTKISQLSNDKGYLTNADFDTSQNHVHSNKAILDKLTQEYIDKIDGIAEGAEQNVQADWSAVSGDSFIKNKPEFAEVATSGSYNDLIDKPTIPSAYTHPTTSGNKHIPSGGSSGQILEWSASGTAKWVTPDFGSSGSAVYYQTTQPSDASKNSIWIK